MNNTIKSLIFYRIFDDINNHPKVFKEIKSILDKKFDNKNWEIKSFDKEIKYTNNDDLDQIELYFSIIGGKNIFHNEFQDEKDFILEIQIFNLKKVEFNFINSYSGDLISVY